MELQLKQLASDQLLAYINQPTLDDQLLFPHLASLMYAGRSKLELSLQILGLDRSGPTFCSYLSGQNSNLSNPLGLIQGGSKHNRTGQWSLGAASRQSGDHRRQIMNNFYHFYHLTWLNRLLEYENVSLNFGSRSANDDEDENDGGFARYNAKSSIIKSDLDKKVRKEPEPKKSAIQDLMLTISAFDVMFIYVRESSRDVSKVSSGSSVNYNSVSFTDHVCISQRSHQTDWKPYIL